MTQKVQPRNKWWIKIKKWIFYDPIPPRKLRLYAILFAIYEFVKTTFFLSITLLAYYNFEEVTALLGIDAVEESEYSLSHDRDVSYVVNGNRFHKANSLISIREDNFNHLLIFISVVWVSTIVLLYGVFKNSPVCIFYWLLVLLVQMGIVLVWSACQKVYEDDRDNIRGLTILALYSSESIPFMFLHMFYKQLKTINKLREVATIAIPCPAPHYCKVAVAREDQIVFNGNNGYTHILTNSNA
ncbi:hypothetical protein ACFFRR_011529 [Megaselia abdita]